VPLAAVLLPMIREWQRPARQTRQEDSPDDPPVPITEPVSRFVSARTAEVTPRHTNRLHTHNRDRIAPGYKDVRSHHTRPDPPIRFVFWVTVEVAGIEPASVGVEPGLLRAQPATAVLSPGDHTGVSPSRAQSL
jgi:hypothetical protein